MHARLAICVSVVTCTSLLICADADAATIKLNPQATYLRQSSSDIPPTSATPVALGDVGVTAGDLLLLEVIGDFTVREPVNETQVSSTTIAVFSGSDNILTSTSLLERIPDAIDAGFDFATASTHFGGLPTDISEDFVIPASVQIVVPAGATHLFVAAHDSHYSDNHDLDNGGLGDYAVRLTLLPPVVPLPASVWAGFGLGGVIATRRILRARRSTHG